MDINTTVLERNLTLFTGPVAVAIAGTFAMVAGGNWVPDSPLLSALKPLAEVLSVAGGVAAAGGCFWAAWRAWLLHRWTSGELNGGCYKCSGPMRHLSGRYGDYSKCLMCGGKREGHH